MIQKTKIRQSKKTLLAPSLLSADFSKLKEEIDEVDQAGVEWLHVDVMDGHFVPNITIGPVVVSSLSKITKIPLDCHLMVSEPDLWIQPFADAGASVITVHVEATSHLHKLIQSIKKNNCLAGVSINPATPVSVLKEILPEIDLVLVMSVNPGFGGQKFIPSTIKKIKELNKLREELELEGENTFLIEVDGGVDVTNIKKLKDAGSDVFVAGSSIFGEVKRAKAVQNLRKAMQ